MYQNWRIHTVFVPLIILCSHLAYAGWNKVFHFSNYKEAKYAADFLKFELKSTKVGLFTTQVDGYVLKYDLSAELSTQEVRNAMVKFSAKSLDTDVDARNRKMWSMCLAVENYPTITVRLVDSIFLNRNEQDINGIIEVRGQEKPIRVHLKVKEEGGNYEIDGAAQVRLSELEIPDPSIFVAKVKDEVQIRFHWLVAKGIVN